MHSPAEPPRRTLGVMRQPRGAPHFVDVGLGVLVLREPLAAFAPDHLGVLRDEPTRTFIVTVRDPALTNRPCSPCHVSPFHRARNGRPQVDPVSPLAVKRKGGIPERIPPVCYLVSSSWWCRSWCPACSTSCSGARGQSPLRCRVAPRARPEC